MLTLSKIRYGQSKLANIVHAAELSRRYPGIISVSVHQGVIQMGLVEDLSFVDKMMVYVGSLWQFTKKEDGILNQLCKPFRRFYYTGVFHELQDML
jgi:hypothetical protein